MNQTVSEKHTVFLNDKARKEKFRHVFKSSFGVVTDRACAYM